jgi:hypothetical protein
MALNKMKKLIEDLENNSTLVMSNPVAKATSAAQAGTAAKATSAGYAGTARIALWGSAGTGALA